MGEVIQANPASLDEVLSAVRETAKGRWFLDAYEARLRGTETSRVLDAISKLETHVMSLSRSGTDAALVMRAREAIAKARRDIGALDPSIPNLSAEAKLFAQLAEKARNSLSAEPAANQSLSRALQLVCDLDAELNSATSLSNASSQSKQFFKQDEALFEPAQKKPASVAAAPAVAPEPPVESSPRGAKLVIHRTGMPSPATTEVGVMQADPLAATPKHSEAPQPAATAATEAVTAEVPAAATRQSSSGASPEGAIEKTAANRIVIIRRKAEDMQFVPMVDQPELAPVSAA